MALTQQPHPHHPRSPAQTEPEDGAWRVTAQVSKWLWNSIKVEKAGGSLVRGVVRSVSQRQKPVATLTHSSAHPQGRADWIGVCVDLADRQCALHR